MSERRYVLDGVEAAMRDQDVEYGPAQHHSPARWGLILLEEVGEAAKEANELEFREGSVNKMRYELLQVAAVCCAWLEDLDAHH